MVALPAGRARLPAGIVSHIDEAGPASGKDAMQKTSEEVYDEFETRWSSTRARQRSKRWRRMADVVVVAVTLLAPIGVIYAWNLRPGWIFIAVLYGSWIAREVCCRWALEDRIEALETKG